MSVQTRSLDSVTVREFRRRFCATRYGARLARQVAVDRLEGWGIAYGSELSDRVAAVVGELAANAVLHGRVPGRDFEVCLRVGAGVVRVEVSDARGEERPPPAEQLVLPAADSERGWGLWVVQAVADRWEVVDRVGVGKTVAAEFREPDLGV
ncbi:ATP-binding protein [Streptomyces pathocidini]|uniref:ATP-binding protein n=1 Tax=Streptomyces pathocidini TaxID=1650571 RepID=UPI003410203F